MTCQAVVEVRAYESIGLNERPSDDGARLVGVLKGFGPLPAGTEIDEFTVILRHVIPP